MIWLHQISHDHQWAYEKFPSQIHSLTNYKCEKANMQEQQGFNLYTQLRMKAQFEMKAFQYDPLDNKKEK